MGNSLGCGCASVVSFKYCGGNAHAAATWSREGATSVVRWKLVLCVSRVMWRKEGAAGLVLLNDKQERGKGCQCRGDIPC